METQQKRHLLMWVLVISLLLVGLVALTGFVNIKSSAAGTTVAVDWGNSGCEGGAENCGRPQRGGGGIGKCPGRSDRCLGRVTSNWKAPDWGAIARSV